jgi:TonB family protein
LRLSYSKAIAKITNNFNVSLLKKRIFMMNKKQTSSLGLAKCALFLPLVAALLLFNSFDLAGSGDTPQLPEEVSEPVSTTSQQEKPVIFTHVESMPVFPGGDAALIKYLLDNLLYPKTAVEKGIQGRVILRFVVKTDGTIDDVQVSKSLDPACDEEAVRAVKAMPKWTPGKQKGEAVAVFYTLPVIFKLSDDKAKK